MQNPVLSLDPMSLVFQSLSMETFMGGFLRQYLHHQDDMLPVCYDFVRMNGPEWKNQLKSLDFVSDFARLASSFPEAWTLLLDNVFPQIPSQPYMKPQLLFSSA